MKNILSVIFFAIALCSCHHIEEFDNNAEGTFDAVWTIVDEHYCFFKEKDIDWRETGSRYRSRVYNGMSSDNLFDACAGMLSELRDGHVNLSSGFATSYYRDWWSKYPQNFDARLVEQYYLGFNYRQLGPVIYGILPQNVGYIRWSSFESGLGDGNINNILSDFWLCSGLIIDIRDNGGGSLTNAEDFIRRFLSERTLVGYMVHKTGPGHDDFSEPWPYYYEPAGANCLRWNKPVAILTNRSTFSAANNFVSIMRYLPGVKIVGARTGGGSGMPVQFDLPRGWVLRLSTVSILDAQGRSTESGIEPTDGYAVDLDPVAALSGTDTMLDRAISAATE